MKLNIIKELTFLTEGFSVNNKGELNKDKYSIDQLYEFLKKRNGTFEYFDSYNIYYKEDKYFEEPSTQGSFDKNLMLYYLKLKGFEVSKIQFEKKAETVFIYFGNKEVELTFLSGKYSGNLFTPISDLIFNIIRSVTPDEWVQLREKHPDIFQPRKFVRRVWPEDLIPKLKSFYNSHKG